MGMAASQARFLQLTARRTNVEFMGQQINQERLALANSSAGLFEKMLTLVPPTPPSSQDDKYYTQGYNFTDPADNLQKKISWVSLNDTSVPATSGVNVTSSYVTNGTPALSGTDSDWILSGDPSLITAAPGATAGFGTTSSTLSVSSADLAATYADGETTTGTDTDLANLMTTMGMTPNAQTAKSVMRYVTVEHNIYDPDGNYKTVKRQTPAILEFDNLERLLNVNFLDDLSMTATNANAGTAGSVTGGITGTGDGVTPGQTDPLQTYSYVTAGTNGSAATSLADFTSLAGTSASDVGQGEKLTYSGVFDQTAFGNDMNKYEFQKAAYDYQIERINMQTKQIQEQDKSLELKMKQLDTEHNAVQTEMEAVQKVINKNIESTFKTFA